ncbi:MAG: hypothetical protein L3J83_09785 [Proteobacteria bacterium]|nr:hypothetical protein [Pseudomonadota bacterium]
MNIEDITVEYLSPHVTILHSIIRNQKDEVWYELELKNTCNKRIWGIKAQLKFYDAKDNFLGFEFDEHEQYLVADRNLALSLSADVPVNTQYAKLTIDAVKEEQETVFQKYFIEILVLSIVLFSLYNYFVK